MVWLQSALLFLHILAAIFWFGSGLTFQHVIVPALGKMEREGQQSFMTSVGAGYGKVIPIVAISTIILGILRGISVGVLGSLNTAYGITWLLAIVGGLIVMFIGARFIGPTAQKLESAQSREEFLARLKDIRRYGGAERAGMLGMIVLMVAMRAGY